MVFVHATLLSTESIVVEMLTTRLGLDSLVIGASSIPLAGGAMLLIAYMSERGRVAAVFRSWKHLLPGSALLAAGLFAWYDSVGRVGASKEGLLAGPLETVIILLLARAFLEEKLARRQLVGAAIAIVGFFATVFSSGLDAIITLGDIEAMLSAAAFGCGVIFVTKLTERHSARSVTGSSLLICGIVLAAVSWTIQRPALSAPDWMALLLFSLLPLTAALSYVVGLSRIGASLTSIIASFSIILTVAFQVILLLLGVEVMLPANLPLAAAGGTMGVLGIYLIHGQTKR